ncbi:long-chain fatty acid--CoA ligase [Acidobacteria bacterium AH-259-O06]|nr:long-chain fatty acid--CoA ligase [Acidobacteria bacterium AH-259-O06]
MEEKIWQKSYDAGVPKQIDFKDLTIPQILDNSAARFPDSPAILFLNSKLTYKELRREVNRLAAALSDLGVKKDSRVAIHLPNLPQTVISFLATVKLGAQAVMTNPLYTPREIEHQWNDAGCEVAITTDFLYDQKLRDIRHKLPVRNFIIASVTDYLRFPIKQLAPIKLRKADPPLIAKVAPGPGIHFFRKLIRSTLSSPPEVQINMEDVALLQYTGGTTGVAKGAMLTHRNLSVNVQQERAWFPNLEEGREVVLGVLPYFHVFGLTTSFLLPLYVGAAMVLMPNPRDIPTMIENISKQRVTLLPAVPAIFNAINQYPGIEKIDTSSVKTCISGSAPLPRAVLERFEELTGSKIVEGFGLTEASPVTHVNPLNGVRKVGSIGLPVPSTEAKIVDAETGQKELAPGEAGELIIRGPQVMKGYWKMPDETSEVIRHGWLYTGDLAAMDEDGYFTIVGRKKDMILASGYNIYPDEIDRLFMAHPAVLEACTIGVPDPKRGETVKSFLVLKPGMSTTAEEIQEFCRQNLAVYKIPKLIEFREQLPKSSVLKLLRRVLRDEELAKLQEEKEKQQEVTNVVPLLDALIARSAA